MSQFKEEHTLEKRAADAALILEKYPDPNLKENKEFLVFCVGVMDRDHPSMKAFLTDLTGLSEIHGEFVVTKLNMTLMGIVDDAIEANDQSLLSSELEKVYPFYASFEDEEALVSKDEMLGMMVEMFVQETE